MRLGYLCFGCSSPVDQPLKNKHWCQGCLRIGYYSREVKR
jgi:hypothetical protein